MSARFTTALHALGMIARAEARAPGAPLRSADLARSINTNPVVVRRVLADLRRAGLVTTRRGVGGGVVLAKPAARISLRAVWEALAATERGPLIGRHPAGPNPDCPIGRCVADYIEGLYGEAEAALKASLAKVTLATVRRELDARLASTSFDASR
jgi:Rrf2 family protein